MDLKEDLEHLHCSWNPVSFIITVLHWIKTSSRQHIQCIMFGVISGHCGGINCVSQSGKSSDLSLSFLANGKWMHCCFCSLWLKRLYLTVRVVVCAAGELRWGTSQTPTAGGWSGSREGVIWPSCSISQVPACSLFFSGFIRGLHTGRDYQQMTASCVYTPVVNKNCLKKCISL